MPTRTLRLACMPRRPLVDAAVQEGGLTPRRIKKNWPQRTGWTATDTAEQHVPPHGIPGSTDGRDAELARGRHTVGCAGPTGPPVLPAFTISGGRRAAERNHDCRHAVACADTDQHRDQRRRSATTPRSTGDPGSGRSAHAPRRAGRSPRCPRDADGVPVNETRMGGSGP